jgi:hypothetical protein
MSIEEQIEHDGDEYWFTETITLIAEQDPVTKDELTNFHRDLAMTDMDDEEKLERALKLLKDIYLYEYKAAYN